VDPEYSAIPIAHVRFSLAVSFTPWDDESRVPIADVVYNCFIPPNEPGAYYVRYHSDGLQGAYFEAQPHPGSGALSTENAENTICYTTSHDDESFTIAQRDADIAVNGVKYRRNDYLRRGEACNRLFEGDQRVLAVIPFAEDETNVLIVTQELTGGTLMLYGGPADSRSPRYMPVEGVTITVTGKNVDLIFPINGVHHSLRLHDGTWQLNGEMIHPFDLTPYVFVVDTGDLLVLPVGSRLRH